MSVSALVQGILSHPLLSMNKRWMSITDLTGLLRKLMVKGLWNFAHNRCVYWWLMKTSHVGHFPSVTWIEYRKKMENQWSSWKWVIWLFLPSYCCQTKVWQLSWNYVKFLYCLHEQFHIEHIAIGKPESYKSMDNCGQILPLQGCSEYSELLLLCRHTETVPESVASPKGILDPSEKVLSHQEQMLYHLEIDANRPGHCDRQKRACW